MEHAVPWFVVALVVVTLVLAFWSMFGGNRTRDLPERAELDLESPAAKPSPWEPLEESVRGQKLDYSEPAVVHADVDELVIEKGCRVVTKGPVDPGPPPKGPSGLVNAPVSKARRKPVKSLVAKPPARKKATSTKPRAKKKR